jgi:hypothetical protein
MRLPPHAMIANGDQAAIEAWKVDALAKKRAREQRYTDARTQRRREARMAGGDVRYYRKHHPGKRVRVEKPVPADEMTIEQLAFETEREYHPERPEASGIATRVAYWQGWRVDPLTGRVYDGDGVEQWPRVGGGNLSLTFAIPGQARKRHDYRATRLAAYCYWGERAFKPGVCVLPIDGDLLNLTRSNLKLATKSQVALARDKKPGRRTHTRLRGTSVPLLHAPNTQRKVDEQTAQIVRAALDAGIAGPKEIAARLGVSVTTVRNIDYGTVYRVIPKGQPVPDRGPTWPEGVKAEAKRRHVGGLKVRMERNRARLEWLRTQEGDDVPARIAELEARLTKYQELRK